MLPLRGSSRESGEAASAQTLMKPNTDRLSGSPLRPSATSPCGGGSSPQRKLYGSMSIATRIAFGGFTRARQVVM